MRGWLAKDWRDRFFPIKRHHGRAREEPLTVCIAARAGNVVVAASDRMLTAGDVQFEPTAARRLLLSLPPYL